MHPQATHCLQEVLEATHEDQPQATKNSFKQAATTLSLSISLYVLGAVKVSNPSLPQTTQETKDLLGFKISKQQMSLHVSKGDTIVS